MRERATDKETIPRGELFFLGHPGTEQTFSGYGLTSQAERPDRLVGLLLVDRPQRVDPAWLAAVEQAYGPYQLLPMTPTAERGIACRMHIDPESAPHLRQSAAPQAKALKSALAPLLETPPNPVFELHWDAEAQAWRSEFAAANELPAAIREVFENTGYGCLALESDAGVVHVCHAADRDIAGFSGKPVRARWQLVEMPTAALIRLNVVIYDRPHNPFRFESFLNAAAEDQLQVLSQLANQERLYLAFYGDDLSHRYSAALPHTQGQWQHLDEIVARALAYWEQLPPEQRDFEQAKAAFMWQNP